MNTRKLTREEVAAMWIYNEDYAYSMLSATKFYRQLNRYEKRHIDQMLEEIDEAKSKKIPQKRKKVNR